MTLLFDLSATQPIGESMTHGGGVYAKVVFEEICSLPDVDIDCFYFSAKEIDDNILKLAHRKCSNVYALSSTNELQDLLTERNYEKVYSALPHNLFEDLDLGSSILYLTIHGCRPLELHWDFYEFAYSKGVRDLIIYFYKFLFKKRYLSKKASQFSQLIGKNNVKLITVSEHSKYSIFSQFCRTISIDDIIVNPSPIKVFDSSKFSVERCSKDYFLVISANRWVKNSYRALKALDDFFDMNPNTNFKVKVLGGSPRIKLKNRSRFIFKGYVSDAELNHLYINAYCLVYPSLNEGFGYPPLEAMRHGVPVIAGANSAIIETLGDSALYVDAKSINELRIRLLQIYANKSLYDRLSDSGRRRYSLLIKNQKEKIREFIEILLR